jgi:cell division transport system permease protein
MPKILKNLINNIKKEKLLSVSNIVVMLVTFLILGIFINVIVYSQTALKFLEKQAQITIFFKDDFTEEKILELQTKLKTDPRISEVNYVSKTDAFKIFTDINKNEPVLLESISANILPASLEIRSKNLTNLSQLSGEFNNLEGMKYFKDVIDKFRYWSSIVYIAGFILLTAFFVISYSVIIATLRTTIHSKGPELEILKLVGATDHYVKNPLILQGVLFGGLSALVAGLIISIFTTILNISGVFSGNLSLGFLTTIFSQLSWLLYL